jgi:hypothetical protein
VIVDERVRCDDQSAARLTCERRDGCLDLRLVVHRRCGDHRIKHLKVDADNGDEVPNEDVAKDYKVDTETRSSR